jgi:hypothetical protein
MMGRDKTSVVAVDALAAFVAFLGFEAEGRDRAGLETGDADRLAGLFAETVRPVLDPAERLVDLGNQLALAIPGAELKSPISLGRRTIGEVRMVFGLFLEMGQRLARFAKDVFFPHEELLLEILKLTLVHEFLVLRRTIFRTLSQNCGCLHENLTPLGTLRHAPAVYQNKPGFQRRR